MNNHRDEPVKQNKFDMNQGASKEICFALQASLSL